MGFRVYTWLLGSLKAGCDGLRSDVSGEGSEKGGPWPETTPGASFLRSWAEFLTTKPVTEPLESMQ